VSCCCEKLVDEAQGQLGNTRGRGRSALESHYQATASEGTAGREDLSVCFSEL
jgi:hypothetical protein